MELPSLGHIRNLVRLAAPAGTDAELVYFPDERERRHTVGMRYRFPDTVSRDNFCYSVHLLRNSVRVLDEGEVVVGTNRLDYQVSLGGRGGGGGGWCGC